MKRREMLQLVSIGALVPHAAAQHCAADHAPSPYTLRFFTPDEHAQLAELMELIIPSDGHSPGARDAKVPDFADWMVSHSSPEVQRAWRDGLKLVRPSNLAEAAAGEENPATEAARFFVRLKAMTVDGYYTSEIGLNKDLGYQGNQYIVKYEGCTHPEHKG